MATRHSHSQPSSLRPPFTPRAVPDDVSPDQRAGIASDIAVANACSRRGDNHAHTCRCRHRQRPQLRDAAIALQHAADRATSDVSAAVEAAAAVGRLGIGIGFWLWFRVDWLASAARRLLRSGLSERQLLPLRLRV